MSIRKLTPELQARAVEYFDESDDRIKQDLKYLKEWLSKQPHLNIRMEDQWLLTFLRGCKYSLERTKDKLDMFYTLRTITPELFQERDPMKKELHDLIANGLFLILPNVPDPAGPALVLFRQGQYDASKANILDVLKLNFIILEILMNEVDAAAVSGIVVVCDLEGVTLTHMTQFTPGIAKKCVTAFQEGYPTRPKGVHFINTPTGFETLYHLFTTFASEKLKKRYFVHKNLDSLYKQVDPVSLPKEYGGEAGSVAELGDKMRIRIEGYKGWLEEDANYFSDERLRPGKAKTSAELFGIDGSFRKLAVD